MSDPITIQLGAGPTFNRLKDDRDYIIKLPTEKKIGAVIVQGGGNIVIKAATLPYRRAPPTMPDGAASTSKIQSAPSILKAFSSTIPAKAISTVLPSLRPKPLSNFRICALSA